MEFYANPKKQVEIEVEGETYLRHCIKTPFVNVGDDYIKLVETYVKPVYQDGDIVGMSEKIIALCQNRIVRREECEPKLLAKFLCKFAMSSAAGPGVSNAYKMQFTINLHGGAKVLYAAVCAGIGKVFGKRGIFYEMLGQEVSGLDGFYSDAFEDYENYGIRIPENPCGVCDEIYEKLGIMAMIVDANDLNVEILGKTTRLNDISDQELAARIMDNPAGQGDELTPFILVRKKNG